MAGSIRPIAGKPGVWEIRVYIGRDEQGRVRHLHQRFRGTRRAAEQALARLLVAKETLPTLEEDVQVLWGPATTINEAIAAWRENGWDDLSPNTAYDYDVIHRLYICNSIGKRRIANLTPYEIEKYFRQLKKLGLSKERVRRVRAILNRACRLARKWSGNVLQNPVADTELPTWSLTERPLDVRSPTAQEVRALISAAKPVNQRLATFIRVLAATGIRRGEACALRWNDVDDKLRRITIDEAIVIGVNGVTLKSPKTKASYRSIEIDDKTVAALMDLKSWQMEFASRTGAKVGPQSFVFSLDPGDPEPPRPGSLSRSFSRIREQIGVSSDIHLHSLRHFQATTLDTIISESQKQSRLGWSTVQMARHYTDAILEEDRRAAEHVGRLLDEV